MEGQRSDTALRPVRMRLPSSAFCLSLPFASPFFARLGTAPRPPVRCAQAPVPAAPAKTLRHRQGHRLAQRRGEALEEELASAYRSIKAQAAIKVSDDEADELLREACGSTSTARTWLSLARLTARVGDAADEARELFERGTQFVAPAMCASSARAVFETKSRRPAGRGLFTQAADMEPGNAYAREELLEESVGNATAT